MDTWGTSFFKVDDDQMHVVKIHLCGYENRNNEGDENLEKAGSIATGSGATASGCLSMYWRYPGGSEARSMERGSFQ
ncbi:MAG: hypothetical protein Q9172_003619 [Xanthocarpia lactea]